MARSVKPAALKTFIESESADGIALALAALAAIVIANSPRGDANWFRCAAKRGVIEQVGGEDDGSGLKVAARCRRRTR